MNDKPYRNDLIRQAMAAHEPRMTSEELAAKSGLSRSTISAIMNGSAAVHFTSLQAVTKAVGLTMQQLFEPKQEADPLAA